ncbi:glycosyltransferase family 4 protein [Rhodococcus sp. JG-3]|uniref:glycosyltransferase family 4 protein n=1 Tax=Rhodococcus sp. JG-3 TaxID=1305835 RepID=UPI000428221F|nr:glycosyltransferase family 4 protein [Rhodococcus sp. JG-3]
MGSGHERVYVVGINYEPEQAGIGPYTSEMVNELVKRGKRVSVITGLPHYPQWKVEKAHVQRTGRRQIRDSERPTVSRVTHYVPENPTLAKRLWMESTFGFRALLELQKWHPTKHDAVILVSPSLISSLLVCIRYKGRRRRPYMILWMQDSYAMAARETDTATPRASKAITFMEHYLIRHVDVVVVIHEKFAEGIKLALTAGKTKVRVVRNWIKSNETRSLLPDQNIRKTLGWPTEAVIVLHSGNIGMKQGLENIVAAAKLSQLSHPNMFFSIIGDGNQRAKIEKLADGMLNLQVRGPLDSDTFVSAMREANVLLVNEKPGVSGMSLPSKLTSYWASARPVICAVEPGSNTHAEARRTGAALVVNAGQPLQLIEAIELLANDRTLRDGLIKNGLWHVENSLSLNNAVDEFEEILSVIGAEELD